MSHCIIVGAGSGLSKSIANKFAKQGHSIGLIARSLETVKSQTNSLLDMGRQASYRQADASNKEELERAILELERDNGKCTTLIYNAAALVAEKPLQLKVETLIDEFAINVGGALVAAQTVLPSMIKHNGGHIIFTGGGLALDPYPEWTSLSLGKSALRSLAFSLHKDLSPKNVSVGIVTICGIIGSNSDFSPDTIANEYYNLASKKIEFEDVELIFRPAGSASNYNKPSQND